MFSKLTVKKTKKKKKNTFDLFKIFNAINGFYEYFLQCLWLFATSSFANSIIENINALKPQNRYHQHHRFFCCFFLVLYIFACHHIGVDCSVTANFKRFCLCCRELIKLAHAVNILISFPLHMICWYFQ